MVLHLPCWRIAFLALWLAGLCSTGARSSPLTWHFSSAGFNGGGGLSGSFVYDSYSNALSGVAIVSGADRDFAGSTYSVADPSYGPYPYEFALLPGAMADATGAPVLDLYFHVPLNSPGFSNGGGSVLFAASEYACGDAGCTYPSFPYRFGEGLATAMFEPGPGTAIGAGLVLIGLVGRQKRTREPTRKDGPGV